MAQAISMVLFLALGVGLYVVFMKRAKKTVATLEAARGQIEPMYRAAPLPGENAPRIVGAQVGQGMFRKPLLLGVTERRLFVATADAPSPAVLMLDNAQISLHPKRADVANDRTTYTEGWEAIIAAAGQNHTLRLHPLTGAPDEARNLDFLMGQLRTRARG